VSKFSVRASPSENRTFLGDERGQRKFGKLCSENRSLGEKKGDSFLEKERKVIRFLINHEPMLFFGRNLKRQNGIRCVDSLFWRSFGMDP
jgi:hypothetical protein